MRSSSSRRPRGGHATSTPNIAHRKLRRTLRPTLNSVSHAKPSASVRNPWEEIDLQDEIHREALAIIEAAQSTLRDLARRSQELRSCVSCDQEDWPGIVRDCFEDMVGDTFGCLPDAIDRAARELRSS